MKHPTPPARAQRIPKTLSQPRNSFLVHAEKLLLGTAEDENSLSQICSLPAIPTDSLNKPHEPNHSSSSLSKNTEKLSSSFSTAELHVGESRMIARSKENSAATDSVRATISLPSPTASHRSTAAQQPRSSALQSSKSSRRLQSNRSTQKLLPGRSFRILARVVLMYFRFWNVVQRFRSQQVIRKIVHPKMAFKIQCCWRRKQQRWRMLVIWAGQKIYHGIQKFIQRVRNYRLRLLVACQPLCRGYLARKFCSTKRNYSIKQSAVGQIQRFVRVTLATHITEHLRLQRMEREALLEEWASFAHNLFREERLAWRDLSSSHQVPLKEKFSKSSDSRRVSAFEHRHTELFKLTDTAEYIRSLFLPVSKETSPSRTETPKESQQLLNKNSSSQSSRGTSDRSSTAHRASPSLLNEIPFSMSVSLPGRVTSNGEDVVVDQQRMKSASPSLQTPRLRSRKGKIDLSVPGLELEFAFSKLLLVTESLERKEQERQLLQNQTDMHEAVRWFFLAFRLKEFIPEHFWDLLPFLTPSWCLQRGVDVLFEEHKHRMDIIEEYDSAPLVYLARPIVDEYTETRKKKIKENLKRRGTVVGALVQHNQYKTQSQKPVGVLPSTSSFRGVQRSDVDDDPFQISTWKPTDGDEVGPRDSKTVPTAQRRTTMAHSKLSQPVDVEGATIFSNSTLGFAPHRPVGRSTGRGGQRLSGAPRLSIGDIVSKPVGAPSPQSFEEEPFLFAGGDSRDFSPIVFGGRRKLSVFGSKGVPTIMEKGTTRKVSDTPESPRLVSQMVLQPRGDGPISTAEFYSPGGGGFLVPHRSSKRLSAAEASALFPTRRSLQEQRHSSSGLNSGSGTPFSRSPRTSATGSSPLLTQLPVPSLLAGQEYRHQQTIPIPLDTSVHPRASRPM